MFSQRLFHLYRPLSTANHSELMTNLTKILEEHVLKKPVVWTRGFLVHEAKLDDGVVAHVYPGIEDENTWVTVSKNGLTVERKLLDADWLEGWRMAPNETKNNVCTSKQ